MSTVTTAVEDPSPPKYILYETPLNVKVLRLKERAEGHVYVDYVSVERTSQGIALIRDLNRLSSL